MTEYWKTEYTDLCDGVTFKFKQLNPVEHINLVTKNIEFEKLNGDKAQYFIQRTLENTIWTKDGTTWNPLVDSNGNPRLPELNTKPAIAFDLFCKFKADVLYPVFSESKTFQSFIQAPTDQNQN